VGHFQARLTEDYVKQLMGVFDLAERLRGKGNKVKLADKPQDQSLFERRASMTWAQCLKRVFNIDIETCNKCGGAVKVIACIEDPVVIRKILSHMDKKATLNGPVVLPQPRAPPHGSLFD
jgi:hypothetical protein